MKILSFYITDISEYSNFYDKLLSDISNKFYGKGYSSLIFAKFISYLRKELVSYCYAKYNKKIKVIIITSYIDKQLIEKYNNDDSIIKIHLNDNDVKNLLNGIADIENFVSNIIDNFNNYIEIKKSFDFDKYLIIQLDNLVDICYSELLAKFTDVKIKKMLIDNNEWKKLSMASAIFQDYYNLFKQDRTQYKNLFKKFLQKMANK